MWTLPNILTLARLVILPVIVILTLVPQSWAATVAFLLYVIGAATDWLDGWIARKYNQTSEFGVFLDPIADKIYVVSILLMLVATDRLSGTFVLLAVIILVREFVVAGLREYFGPKNVKFPVSKLAKWKTASQMIAIGFLIIGPYMFVSKVLGHICLLAATGLTVATGWDYLKTGLAYIRKHEGDAKESIEEETDA